MANLVFVCMYSCWLEEVKYSKSSPGSGRQERVQEQEEEQEQEQEQEQEKEQEQEPWVKQALEVWGPTNWAIMCEWLRQIIVLWLQPGQGY